MKIRNHVRRHAYRWHRRSSMIIALPLLLWTISGFLHPVMSYFKPAVASTIARQAIDPAQIRLQPAEALAQNGIDSFRHLQIITLDSGHYYQVQLLHTDVPVYLSTRDGRPLPGGDARYAISLARRYLSTSPSAGSHNHQGMAMLGAVAPASTRKPAATGTVQRLDAFTSEYRAANQFLPVYRVNFTREDGLRLYVETTTGKLALAMDNTRSWYVRFFAWAHTWSFLDGLGLVRNLAVGLLSLLCLVNGLLGIYVYNLVKKKKATGNPARKLHRVLGNGLVVFVLLFAFTGAWHSLQKLDRAAPVQAGEAYAAGTAVLPATAWKSPVTAASLSRIDGHAYWRMVPEHKSARYIDPRSGDTLAEGEVKHARSLLRVLTHGEVKPERVSPITRFNDRYPMSNKRLPVMELETGSKRFYVETATGTLAAVGAGGSEKERWVFSNLHMQHFWEDLLGKGRGKDVGNGVLIALMTGLMLLAVSGLLAWARKRGRKTAST